MLFNLYSEYIFREALEDESAGIAVNGNFINNIRYADDIAIIANTLEDLQKLFQKVAMVSRAHGLNINIKKTKMMVILKKVNNNGGQLVFDGQVIERVSRYKYLGTIVNENNQHTEEVRARIEHARAAFIKMKNILTAPDLSMTLRITMVRCYVFPILLYGVENWTLRPL